mmetsp:Transcript_100012/g.291725  ORF Transcript_100012/g.291725 Transcript_100012/m.291725 type:complete len:93 (+) Transcript_100012:211-489(+)
MGCGQWWVAAGSGHVRRQFQGSMRLRLSFDSLYLGHAVPKQLAASRARTTYVGKASTQDRLSVCPTSRPPATGRHRGQRSAHPSAKQAEHQQ